MIDELLLLMHFIYELSKLEFCTKKENLETFIYDFFYIYECYNWRNNADIIYVETRSFIKSYKIKFKKFT